MNDPVRFEFERPKLERPREFSATLTGHRWLTPHTLRLAFRPTEETVPFEPGQYASLVLPEDSEQGLRRELRPYSLWNHPREGTELVTILRRVDGGRASQWLSTMELGTNVRLVGPLGSFTLRRPLHDTLLFVATGTGLVPLRCMIADLKQTGELQDHDIDLLFGVRHEEDLFELQELQGWASQFQRFSVHPTLSQPGDAWPGLTGRVTDHLKDWDLPIDACQVYLCGNGAMITDALALLEARGLNRRTRRIVYEKYFD